MKITEYTDITEQNKGIFILEKLITIDVELDQTTRPPPSFSLTLTLSNPIHNHNHTLDHTHNHNLISARPQYRELGRGACHACVVVRLNSLFSYFIREPQPRSS